MVLNWLVAGLLLLSYLAQKKTPSQHTVIAIMGLVYPLLLFANLFFVLFWFAIKNPRGLVSLLIIFMGFPHLKTNIAFHSATSHDKPNALKVLTYNVRGFSVKNGEHYQPAVKSGILSFLLKQKPDIICFQEYAGKRSDLLMKTNGSIYFHDYYTGKKKNNSGLVIASIYPLLHGHYLKYQGYRTYGIYADILYGKDTLRVINVHLASISLEQDDLDLLTNPSSPDWDKPNVKNHFLLIYRKLQRAFSLREKQINKLAGFIKNSRFPVILCGDFNDTPSSWAYHRMRALLNDAFVARGMGWSPTYAGPLPLLRIDYLFADRHFKILSYKKYPLKLSDHFPVAMQVVYQP